MAERVDEIADPELLVLRYLEDPRPELKSEILKQFSGLVERTARKFSGLESQEDLVQVGYIGLLNALGKFDPQAGVRFTTYAAYLVSGEIKHHLRDRVQTIRQPAWLQEMRHKAAKAASALQNELGRIPSEREIAERIGAPEEQVRDVFQTQDLLRIASLDATAQGDDDSDTEGERLDASAYCPEQLTVEERVILDRAMGELRQLERDVLIHFHVDSMNQTEIANRLGISCNYVSHILRQSLGKLRRFFVGEEQKDNVLRRQASALDYDVLDGLTGAYTEPFFRARLEEEIHRASAAGDRLGIVLIKFQGLESLGAFYGESSVHAFLADVAEVLRDSVRRLDIVARYGDTGFAVILPFVKHGVEIVRERLMEKAASWMRDNYATNNPVWVELGAATAPEEGRSAAELIASAVLVPAADRAPIAKAA